MDNETLSDLHRGQYDAILALKAIVDSQGTLIENTKALVDNQQKQIGHLATLVDLNERHAGRIRGSVEHLNECVKTLAQAIIEAAKA